MPMYALGILPLIQHSSVDVNQVWYADDAAAIGTVLNLNEGVVGVPLMVTTPGSDLGGGGGGGGGTGARAPPPPPFPPFRTTH